MSSMLARVARPKIQPPRIVIHGRGGVGKTTFAADAKAPIFLPFEDGMGKLQCDAFPRPDDFGDVLKALLELLNEKHDYKTLVIDAIDGCEPLLWDAVAADNKAKSLEDVGGGYGKGYIAADKYWRNLFDALDGLRSARGMTVIVLAHSEVAKIQDPVIGPYDRVQPKLHKRANALLVEWADIVGHLDVERMNSSHGDGSRKVKYERVTGVRKLYLEESAGYAAKNRFTLAPVIDIPLENPFNALRTAIAAALKGE